MFFTVDVLYAYGIRFYHISATLVLPQRTCVCVLVCVKQSGVCGNDAGNKKKKPPFLCTAFVSAAKGEVGLFKVT